MSYIEVGKTEGTLLVGGTGDKSKGWFIEASLKMEEILKLVSEFIKEKQSKKEWVAGKDLVQYAGDYFNEDEYIAAVPVKIATKSPVSNETKMILLVIFFISAFQIFKE